MPDKLDILFEKGFIGSVMFMLTGALTLLGFKLNSDREFKNLVHRKIDRNDISINAKLDDHKRHMLDNHPSNNEFKMLVDMVTSIDDYIKDKK